MGFRIPEAPKYHQDAGGGQEKRRHNHLHHRYGESAHYRVSISVWFLIPRRRCSAVWLWLSRIAQMAIIDALVVAVSFKRFERSKQYLTLTDKILVEDKM